MSIAPLRLCALAVLTAFIATAHATETGQRKPPAKVTFQKAPSEESPAAREKRLKRECKGRPNAGMCLGYTR
ncbi:hypothetical protein [Hydrogenophaga sp.]|uniref:hypothetical protein n=1 Tax=Hydrogenophaga sp. TaxID=1904254 RepID=UPI003D11B9E9